MNAIKALGALGTLMLVLAASGCVVERDHGYRYENGDRIDRWGHRDVHWCDDHRDDDHCRR
ncbi:MAG TPA: hypothetical protein VMT29_17305 [Steroidobacteraceae bacterium]|nr:hypothetical protein [Steroidobacteraceae bacterium]